MTHPKAPTSFDFRIVDSHCHVWRYTSPWMEWLTDRPASWDVVRRDFSWRDLREVTDGVGGADLILVQACTTPDETRWLLEGAAERADVLGVVGWVTLAEPRLTEADLARLDGPGRAKLVGIRNNHGWAPDFGVITKAEAIESCQLVADRGLTLDLHIPDYTHLPAMVDVIERVGRGVFIVDHLGKPKLDDPGAFAPWAQSISDLATLPGVFLKYSGWATFMGRAQASDVRRYVEHALAAFGPRRMMYASNWPVALVAADYRATYDATLEAAAALDAEDFRQLMRATALRCYLGED